MLLFCVLLKPRERKPNAVQSFSLTRNWRYMPLIMKLIYKKSKPNMIPFSLKHSRIHM